DGSANDADGEAVFYPFTKSRCFQAHPEYEDGKACRNYFFGLIEGHLFHKWDRYEKVTGYNPYDEEEDFVRPMDIKQAVLADALIEDED
ncbi:MAG: hypothetical protein GY800_06685, partial [Planctomycetes bacterium]|nr:hypothetical protein [Planctomycetota bacterium]